MRQALQIVAFVPVALAGLVLIVEGLTRWDRVLRRWAVDRAWSDHFRYLRSWNR